MDLIEDSSDLEMGRRPELKSDEFLIRSILCNEIMSILVEIARILCHHLLGFEVLAPREKCFRRFPVNV